ncbi:MAG: hypothetical protein DKT66_13220 [Candidatus Melainabacteria bacterium]|nr:MAG: hypothetical protein DKT66_13220 [Candidatus Melainabacteria bacterium]
MEVLRVWLTGVKNMFVGQFERENERLEAAKHSSTRLKAIKHLSLPPVGEEHKSVMDTVREEIPVFAPRSRKDITHHRLEALSAKFAE